MLLARGFWVAEATSAGAVMLTGAVFLIANNYALLIQLTDQMTGALMRVRIARASGPLRP